MHTTFPGERVQTLVDQSTANYPDTHWGITIMEPDGNVLFAHNETEIIGAASLNKLTIAHATEIAGIALDTEVELQNRDRADGNGILRLFPEGYKLPFGEVTRLMLSISDNTAAKIAVRMAGGPGKVNSMLAEARALRVGASFLDHLKPEDSDDTAAWEYGITTSHMVAHMLRTNLDNLNFNDALHHGDFVGGLRRRIESPIRVSGPTVVLSAAKVAHRLGRRVWAGAYRSILAYQPQYTPHPNKEGTYEDDGLRHDVAQIGNLTIAVLSKSTEPEPAEGLHHTRRLQADLGLILGKAA